MPNYIVSDDGQFLMVRNDESAEGTGHIIVLNWYEVRKRLVPVS